MTKKDLNVSNGTFVSMSVAEEVRLYLRNKPYILEALEKDIVNLSKLSRIIQKELETENIHAVKAALRRYSEKLRKVKRWREERVLNTLKESKITILDNVSIIIATRNLEIENKVKVKLDSHHVFLIEKAKTAQLKKEFKNYIARTHEKCTAIIISSPEQIEKVSGVVAFLTSLLSKQNINVLEFISCFTDTIVVVDRADALGSYETLSKLIG